MDSIKGALVLRERFDRHGLPEPPRPGEAASAGALPIFHWVVNEPRLPDASGEQPAAAAG